MNMDQQENKPISTVSASVTEKSHLNNHSGHDDAVQDPVKQRNPIIRLVHTYDMPIYNLFYLFGFAIVTNADQDLLLAKVCQNSFGYTAEQCANRTENESSEGDEVYQESNTFLMYKTLISTGPAVVMLLFLGPWSDKYGYKFPMIWATSGVFMNSVGLLLNSVFFQLPALYVVLSSIPLGLTGGDIAVMSVIAAYIGSKTQEKERVFMLLMVELCGSFSELAGTLATGIIYHNHGYTSVFLSSTCFLGAAVLWQIVVVSEKPPHQGSLCTKAKDFFSLQDLKEMVTACVKKRSGWLRIEIWALLLSSILQNAAFSGSQQVLYYFTNKMYSWDLSKFTQFKTIINASNVVILPCVMAVVKRWKISDVHLGIFVAACVTGRYVILMFAYTEWLFYISCALSAFSNSLNVVLNSLLMSCLEENEYGKLFAMKAGLLSAVPLIASPVATGIFNHTIGDFIGAVFLYCACCQAVPLIILMMMLRKATKKSYSINPVTYDQKTM